MFTDRFIKVPIETYNVKEAELTGISGEDAPGTETYMMINPMEILSYRPNETWQTCVVFKNGNHILVYMPVHEFEKLLNYYGK